MAANRRDEWTHSGTCLCYRDNQCPRPTRFYPRYLRKRNPGAFVPTTWDRDSANAGTVDRHGNRCQCLPRATSFGDLVTGSVQFTKSSSLVSLSPEVISVQPTVWKSSSMWSLPAENAVTMATVNSDPGFGQEVRAYKWQPSYSSGSGVSPYGGEGRGKYAAGKTGTGLEFARERESTGLSYSRLLKKMGKAGRWLRKLGQRHGDGAPRKKDKKEALCGRAKSVQDINSKVAEQVESCYGMSLNGQSGGVDVEWEESTSSGASSVDFSEFSDQRTYSLPSLKDKRSDAGLTKCHTKTYSLPSLKDKRSDAGLTKCHTKPLSRSVDGLLCDDGLKRTTELCPSDARGPVSGLSAALHRLLRRDHGDMASQSPDGSTGSSGSKVIMRNRRMSTPHPIRSRAVQSVICPPPCQTHLKRAHSAPEIIDVEDGGLRGHRKQDMFRVSLSTAGDLAVPSHNYSSDDDSEDSLSYGIVSMTTSSLSLQHQAAIEEIFEVNEMTTYAEALWDHVTMDPEELGFRAGDVIEVTDTRDKNWWYGHIADKHGWFPASFVRLRANQVEIIAEDASILVTSQKHSRESVSQSEARTNVVNEIVQAEGEYVRHLRDVIQGYVEKCRRRPEMFPPQTMTAIFSNVTDIYDFSVKFLKDLEANVDKDQPHQSKLGKVFIKHREGFKIYSEYCNNHPTAQEELRKLQKNKVYTHFFEACRLLQDMINLPLEGFLLAPVQKICKYPLQLRELLKYTPRCHGDHDDISNALDTMHGIAVMINERKRKMESIEKLAEWQLTVEDWQGPDLLDHSSELIYSGEMTKVKSPFLHQERVFFLFDHQLIYCKKVLLWRDVLVYKGRINLDKCNIKALADEKDPVFNINVKNALRIYNDVKKKWHLIYCRTPEERGRWFAAFQEERRRVEEDRKNGFSLEEFRSKAHLPQKCVKKHKKKHKVHHSKTVEKQPFVTSEDVTSPEIQDAQDSSRRWMMFSARKQKM